jgi:hypothetical protein
MTPATRLAAGLLVAVLLAGCAPRVLLPRPGATPAAPGRLLVIARQPAVENRGIAERAADLMAQGLRPAGEVWTADEFVREAAAVGATAWALGLVERLRIGGWPTVDDRAELLRFAVMGVLATEVTAYEQVWGKYAKFTRAGVEARGFDVASGAIVWRMHRAVEIEDVRGRAFEHAIESAVGALVAAVSPGTAFSAVDLWRVWRR